MQEGQKKLLSTITFQGADYHLVVWMQMALPNAYSIILYKGDWQAASPEIIASAILDDTIPQQNKWPDPKDYVTWAAGILQANWAKIQGNVPPPAPETWSERLEAWLLRVAFFCNADGTHTVQIV